MEGEFNMFKEMTASFKVAKDTAFLEKGFYKDRSQFEFTIKRQPSGCFKYGDRSAHSLYVNGGWSNGYDTRYDGISTEKDKWLAFWKKFIEEEWGLELKLVDYQEQMVEFEED